MDEATFRDAVVDARRHLIRSPVSEADEFSFAPSGPSPHITIKISAFKNLPATTRTINESLIAHRGGNWCVQLSVANINIFGTKTLTVADVGPAGFDVYLRFLYTGKIFSRRVEVDAEPSDAVRAELEKECDVLAEAARIGEMFEDQLFVDACIDVLDLALCQGFARYNIPDTLAAGAGGQRSGNSNYNFPFRWLREKLGNGADPYDPVMSMLSYVSYVHDAGYRDTLKQCETLVWEALERAAERGDEGVCRWHSHMRWDENAEEECYLHQSYPPGTPFPGELRRIRKEI